MTDDATLTALKALRDEARRLRREGIDAQVSAGDNTLAHIIGAHLCAASGRLLSTARKLEEQGQAGA